MAGTVIIETYGTELVARELEITGARGGDMRGIWPEIIRRMERMMTEQFATRGLRGREYWPDLSLDWIRRKFQAGMNLNILRATDAMYEALTSTTGDSVREMDSDYLAFGANLPQFRIHQNPPKDANFPTRRPLVFNNRDRNEFAQMMMEWTLGVVNTRGQFIDPSTGRFASRDAG